MFFSICKKLHHIKPRVSTPSYGSGYLFSTSSIKTIENDPNSTDQQSLAVSYLLKSCGLSLESAISASKKLQIETTDQPDLILKLLKSHGLTQTHIGNLIANRPAILLADPNKTLKPNIELFCSLGLSGTNLGKVFDRVPQILESSNVNSVVEFFTNNGFSGEQITNMTLKYPILFTYNPEKNFKPKLDFLQSLGFSASEVGKIISVEPYLLSRSLEKHIIPCIRDLKQIVCTDENVRKVIKADYGLIFQGIGKGFLSNVSTLKSLGVPESNVLKLILRVPKLLRHGTENFSRAVREVTELGFHPTKMVFIAAIRSSVINKSLWEEKIEVFSSFGLSRNEFFLAFKLHPMFVVETSKKKLEEVMGFLVNKLHFEPSLISRHPRLLLHSLEKRIIPRCSVLQLLMLKDLIKRDICLVRVFIMTEKNFVENFVTKYQHVVPEVVDAHRGEIEFQGFNINCAKGTTGMFEV